MSGYLEDFARRVIQDALAEATAAYWMRRADQLENARPRPGEFHGNASAEELNARDERLAALAENCRHHAELLRDPELWRDELAEHLDGEAA